MKYIYTLLFSVCSFALIASENQLAGARSAGMGNASVTLSDAWSVFHNQAGLARLEKITAGAYYENRFLVPELGVKALALAMPTKSGVFGVSLSQFGFSLYNESKVGVAYSMLLSEKVSGGIQLNYLNTFIGEGYGNRGVFTGEAGVQAEVAPGLIVGAHIFNPFRVRLAHYANERIPVIMRLGLGYKISEKVLLCAETQKNSDLKPIVRVGMEYHITEQLYLRAGVSTNPSMNTFGAGLNLKNFRFDFSSSIHSVLGYSPQISLTRAF
jgi:hypothetical protein